MLPETRVLAEAFYAPHNARLASLLGDPALSWPDGSLVSNGTQQAVATRDAKDAMPKRSTPML
eukprot:6188733-Pleurochrysis_carterae.AAC.2